MPLLPRLQLFEFLDQAWLPGPLRRGEVDYLRVVLERAVAHASSRSGASVTLTDLHPTPATDLPEGVRYHPTPVDATHVLDALVGVRTIFEGLHHFPPEAARALLADAAARKVEGIGGDGHRWSWGVERARGVGSRTSSGSPPDRRVRVDRREELAHPWMPPGILRHAKKGT